MLNARLAEMTRQLMAIADFLTITELADQLQVSPRTVRYDLDKLDDWLAANDLPGLDRLSGKGIRLRLSDSERQRVLAALREAGSYDYVLSPGERRQQIFAALVGGGGRVTLSKLSKDLSVSKVTLVNDLKQVRRRLQPLGVVVSSDNKGLRISGKETDIRDAFYKHVLTALDEQQLFELLYGECENWQLYLRRVLPGSLVSSVEKALRQSVPGKWSSEHFAGLLLLARLTFVVQRMLQGHVVARFSAQVDDAWLDCGQLMLDSLVEFDLDCKQEVRYLGWCLQVGIVGDSQFVREYVRAMIDAISEKTDLQLRLDLELAEGLYNHLLNSGIQAGAAVENPLLSQIQANHADIYTEIEEWCQDNDFGGVIPSPGEVGYIALHFAAALERLSGQTVKRKALVVCSNGIGTARMLAVKVQNNFPALELVEVASYSNFRERQDFEDIDLIISTLPLPEVPKPVVVVSPFLSTQDINRLARFLGDSAPGWRNQEKLVADVLDIVGKHSDKVDYLLLRAELNHYFRRTHASEDKSALTRLLKFEHIQVLAGGGTWQEAVSMAAAPLLADDYIRQQYVDAMLAQIQTLGPHIVIAPGVAMPHAKWEEGALRPGISLAVLREPVRFGHKANDPVRLVFVLVPGKKNEHLSALEELFDLVASERNVCALAESDNPTAVWKIITQSKVEEQCD
ncbi:MAG: BglG family transcription antiterminator [Firmicutes bacterium]|nr:BglG family transcription antiterminator [Bacillota bacterium]